MLFWESARAGPLIPEKNIWEVKHYRYIIRITKAPRWKRTMRVAEWLPT